MPNSISDKIKYLRALHGLTLEEVAARVGVGKSTVRKWETGQIANMRRDKIAKLASALHTTPAYLMGWAEDAPATNSERPLSDAELKFALWGSDDIDDEDLEDVRRYAAFVTERKKAKK